MKNKTEYSQEWTLTDVDTNQYGRQLSIFIFEFKEDNKEQTAIDLTGYTNKQIEQTINAYGYTMEKGKKGLENIFELYGDKANWIVAECIFESE